MCSDGKGTGRKPAVRFAWSYERAMLAPSGAFGALPPGAKCCSLQTHDCVNRIQIWGTGGLTGKRQRRKSPIAWFVTAEARR